jgi:hypothetical protein
MASVVLRENQSVITKQMIADGTMRNNPAAASAAARTAGRGSKTSQDRQMQSEIARLISPKQRIADGGKYADGRDATNRRQYQRARRAREKNQ